MEPDGRGAWHSVRLLNGWFYKTYIYTMFLCMTNQRGIGTHAHKYETRGHICSHHINITQYHKIDMYV